MSEKQLFDKSMTELREAFCQALKILNRYSANYLGKF